MAAHREHQVVVLNGLRDRVFPETRGLPQEAAGFEIVAAHLFSADDDLAPAFVQRNIRRRPVETFRARRPPDLAPGLRIQHHQETFLEVIEVQQQAAVMQRQRRAFAERHVHAHLDAEVLLPDQRSVHVVGIEAAGSEERINARAVGDRRVRREAAVSAMVAFVRRGHRCGPLPQQSSRGAIDRQDFKAVLEPGIGTAARAASAPWGRSLSGRHRRRQEHPMPRDHGCRVPAPWDRELPADVACAPRDRRVADRHTGIERTTPLRPFDCIRRAESQQHGGGRNGHHDDVHLARIS